MATATVVLGGGAPNGALTAGALSAIYENGKTFNTFYTAGAGAVFGLLTVAPKNCTTVEALKNVLAHGIHKDIYNVIPLGYKTFYKSGPFTKPFKSLADRIKFDDERGSEARQLYNDWVDLWVSAVTPTFVNPWSKAVCAPYPFLDDFIDFDKLRRFQGHFYMNAFCIESGRMEVFNKEQILADPEAHFHAALAFPFIYPPGEIGGKHYYEGSAIDPLSLPNLAELWKRRQIPDDGHHTIVLIDVLGSLEKGLIRLPRHLLDAYGISIITPIWALATTRREIFDLRQAKDDPRLELKPLEFHVPARLYETLTDWRRDTLKQLFDVGHAAGEKFVSDNGDLLPNREPGGPSPAGAPIAPAFKRKV